MSSRAFSDPMHAYTSPQAMSVVICGTVIPRSALSPDAVQALAASENPSLAGPSPPPSALVPPPPPRPSPQPNLHQQQHPHAMAVDGSVPPPPPPPPPARQQRSPGGAQPPPPPPPATGVVPGGTTAPAVRKRPASTGAASENASSPPPPPPPSSTAGPSKVSSPPKAWALLALPSVEKALGATAGATVAGGGDVTVDGVSAADLAPYGEADLLMALTAQPERLQRLAGEANPFNDRFLVPVGAARRVREAVTRLVSLGDASGPEGRTLEVCMVSCDSLPTRRCSCWIR